MRRVLAISQREEFIQTRSEMRDNLDQALINFFYQAGNWVPIPVPNSLIVNKHSIDLDNAPLIEWLSTLKPAAIVLTGGDDPRQETSRSVTENTLIDYAMCNRLPLFGICRGMLAIGMYFGAKLIEVSGHVNVNHMVVGEITQYVNSYHTLALDECPEHFQITSRDEKNLVIESIRHNSLKIAGQMWHPERATPYAKADLERLDKFLREV